MAKDLKDVRGEYVFFAAYLQKDSEQENWEVNGNYYAWRCTLLLCFKIRC